MHTGVGFEEGRNRRDVGGLRNNAAAEEKPRTVHFSALFYAEDRRTAELKEGRGTEGDSVFPKKPMIYAYMAMKSPNFYLLR